MNFPFLLFAFIFILPLLVLIAVYAKALDTYIKLYRKKKNLDYPVLPGEVPDYLRKGPEAFMKIFMIPSYSLQIFENHKDKELNAAAKRVRFAILAYFVVMIIELFLIIKYIVLA